MTEKREEFILEVMGKARWFVLSSALLSAFVIILASVWALYPEYLHLPYVSYANFHVRNHYAPYTKDYMISCQNCTEIKIDKDITSIQGNLYIENNPKLESLKGLEGITSISGHLHVWDNESLENLDGLESLTRIGEYVGVSVWIKNNRSLKNIDGLKNAVEIAGDIVLEQNPVLKNLDGFKNLKNFDHGINLWEQESLEDIRGLSSLTQAGDLILYKCNKLSSLKGLHNIVSLKGKLLIEQNDSLANIDELEKITYIGGELKILGNKALQNLHGLRNLVTMDAKYQYDIYSSGPRRQFSDITIQDNKNLSNCEIEQLVSRLVKASGWSGGLSISGNADSKECASFVEDYYKNSKHPNGFSPPR